MTEQEYLAHFGVKGMKWGVRKDPERYSDHKLRRMARKDAKKYVDAKMYYGEGAGNRRKLLKADRSNLMKNKVYKDAFDEAVNNADYAKSASKARRDRKMANAGKIAGRIGKATLGVGIAVATMYATAHASEISDFVSRSCKQIGNKVSELKLRKEVADILNRKG